MTIEKLERVMWRLRKRHPDRTTITNNELRRAIMYECGTSLSTLKDNRRALKDLGWIRAKSTRTIWLTNKDIDGGV